MSLFDSSPQNYNQNFQMPQIDPMILKQAMSRLDQNSLNQLVQQARFLGMSNEQIQAGLDLLRKM